MMANADNMLLVEYDRTNLNTGEETTIISVQIHLRDAKNEFTFSVNSQLRRRRIVHFCVFERLEEWLEDVRINSSDWSKKINFLRNPQAYRLNMKTPQTSYQRNDPGMKMSKLFRIYFGV